MKFPVLCLFLLFHVAAPCLNQFPGGGSPDDSPRRRKPPTLPSPSSPDPSPETTPNTTSSPTPSFTCLGPGNNPGIFIAASAKLRKDARFTGAKPTKECPCGGGTKFFFGENTESDWVKIRKNEKHAFELQCLNGKKPCFCVSDDECYESSEDDTKHIFASFCENGSCGVYMTCDEDDTDLKMVPTKDKGTEVEYNSYVNGEDLKPLPGPFKKITTVGCGECPKVTC
uniref:Uncharacterized protein n=1 Tax=Steinernema glaseri TaxID=37863 RepID=A0A1I7Z265_9BILA